MDAKQFGARLKELREGAGLTQTELADKAGLSQRAVSHWEQGLREPVLSNLVALSEALGVDCTAFLEAPAGRPPAGPGRPRKERAEEPAPKRGKERPRKGG